MTLTLELSELRCASDRSLEQLGSVQGEEFEQQLAEIQNFLLSIYRFAVLAVQSTQEINHAADIWRETLDLIDNVSGHVHTVAARRASAHPALAAITQIREAAKDMLALYE